MVKAIAMVNLAAAVAAMTIDPDQVEVIGFDLASEPDFSPEIDDRIAELRPHRLQTHPRAWRKPK